MKKKLAALLCGVLFVGLLATPVYAAGQSQPQGDDPAITVTDGGIEGDAVVAGALGTGAEPVSVTAETVDGVPYITKVYELALGTDIAAYTAAFEQDGFVYSRQDVTEQRQEDLTHSKTVSQSETVESESGKVADIVAEAAPVVLYGEGGYTGQLTLDASAIVVEENGVSTYSYRVEDVREYTNLDRNDAAYVPKTVLKNGATLQLENIEWVVTGQHPVDGRMVPNLFKAIATYAGTATGSRASGYTSILTYTGEVTKTTPGKCVYTVVFRGEPVATEEPGQDVPAPVDTEKKGGAVGTIIMLTVIILLSAACLAVAGVRIVQRIRDRRNEQDGDYTGEDFSGYGGYAEEIPGPVEPDRDDTRYFEPQAPQEPQPAFPQQTYPPDEFSIDDLFNEEGFFNE